MGLTNFGALYLPLVLGAALLLPRWLPALLMLSTVLQAASVLNLPVAGGLFGVSPYNATALVCALVLARWLWRDWRSATLSQAWSLSSVPTVFAWAVLVYTVVAVVGSFVLPRLFEGLPVQSHVDAGGYYGSRVPLKWSIFNLVQAANLMVHVTMLAYVWQCCMRDPRAPSRLILGLVAAVVLVVAAGAYEQIALRARWPSAGGWWMSNPGYAQAGINPYPGFVRVGVPFTEPSFASAFLASAALGGLAALLWSPRWALGAVIFLLAVAGLASTMGSTGLVTFACGAAVLVAGYYAHAVYALLRGHTSRLPRLLVVTCVLVCGAYAAVKFGQEDARAQTAVLNLKAMTTQKLASEFAEGGRWKSDLAAIELAKSTDGLGVGMGSNRTNSYVTSLLSNVGVLGLLAWVTAVLALLVSLVTRVLALNVPPCRKTGPESPASPSSGIALAFALGGLLGSSIAMGLAIPDLNMPMYWGWVMASLACCVARRDRAAGGSALLPGIRSE